MTIPDFFAREQITLYAAIDFSDCVVINGDLLSRSMPGCRSVILYALPYFTGLPEKRNLSLYALSKDYHLCIKEVNRRLIEALGEEFPRASFVGFGDHSPINERLAAARAGLGVRGDNGLLITADYGSYVFLGEVLTTVEPSLLGAKKPEKLGECLHCGACMRACPTGFDGCASQYSQKKGELTEKEAQAVRRTGLIWGCDLCQTCCPLNRDVRKTPIPFFYEDRIESIDEQTLCGMDKQSFRRRAFSWHGKSPLLRNLKLTEDACDKA